jgi:hypothetical protein
MAGLLSKYGDAFVQRSSWDGPAHILSRWRSSCRGQKGRWFKLFSMFLSRKYKRSNLKMPWLLRKTVLSFEERNTYNWQSKACSFERIYFFLEEVMLKYTKKGKTLKIDFTSGTRAIDQDTDNTVFLIFRIRLKLILRFNWRRKILWTKERTITFEK